MGPIKLAAMFDLRQLPFLFFLDVRAGRRDMAHDVLVQHQMRFGPVDDSTQAKLGLMRRPNFADENNVERSIQRLSHFKCHRDATAWKRENYGLRILIVGQPRRKTAAGIWAVLEHQLGQLRKRDALMHASTRLHLATLPRLKN
jgi:hypothetical protein